MRETRKVVLRMFNGLLGRRFGISAIVAVAVSLVAACSHTSAPGPRIAADSGTAIVNATVIDATGAPPKPGMTILVQQGRIAAIAPAETVRLGPDVEVVEGTGKFVIPGLWDMHTHVAEYAPIWLPVMLAHGITDVRNMHAVSLELTNDVKRQVDGGALRGARMVANGPLVDGPASPWPTATKVDSAQAATAAVSDLAEAGADFVKVYSFLSRDAYFAIAAEAKRRGLSFEGHVPQSISAVEASEAGQHSIEHLDGVLLALARDEASLRQRFLEASAAWRNPATAAQGQLAMIAVNGDLAAYDEAKAAAVFATFTANRTYQTPTLVTYYTNNHRAEPEISANPALRFIPATLRAQWSSVTPPNVAMQASQLALFARYQAVVKAMQDSGVGILAGTDTGGTLIVPGDSLHRELALLVEAGLSPLQALQAATRNPARYFGQERVSGTIEVGKNADLVLLDRDPLADIGNTREIAAVMQGGRLFRASDLRALLERAAEAALAQ